MLITDQVATVPVLTRSNNDFLLVDGAATRKRAADTTLIVRV